MSTLPTQPFRDEHKELVGHIEHLRQAALELPELSVEERELLLDRMLGFLRHALAPHAAAEERVLYPAAAELLGSPDALAAMVHDHVAIHRLIDRLEATETTEVAMLQEILFGLHALISVHFEKEEEIILPLLDAAPPGTAELVLAEMAAQAGNAHDH